MLNSPLRLSLLLNFFKNINVVSKQNNALKPRRVASGAAPTHTHTMSCGTQRKDFHIQLTGVRFRFSAPNCFYSMDGSFCKANYTSTQKSCGVRNWHTSAYAAYHCMHSAHRTGWVMMVSRRIARSHQRQELISAKIKIAWLQTDVRFPQDIYSTRHQEALDSFS